MQNRHARTTRRNVATLSALTASLMAIGSTQAFAAQPAGMKPALPPKAAAGAKTETKAALVGRVSAVIADGFTLAGPRGDITVKLDDKTKIAFDRGPAAPAAAIQAGSQVLVIGRRSGNTITAENVRLVQPSTEGIITAVDGDRLTLAHGAWRADVTLGATTVVGLDDTTLHPDALRIGEIVRVFGTEAGAGIAAVAVAPEPARIQGVVTARAGDAITLATPTGELHLTLDAHTHYAGSFAGQKGAALAIGSTLDATIYPAGDALVALSVAPLDDKTAAADRALKLGGIARFEARFGPGLPPKGPMGGPGAGLRMRPPQGGPGMQAGPGMQPGGAGQTPGGPQSGGQRAPGGQQGGAQPAPGQWSSPMPPPGGQNA